MPPEKLVLLQWGVSSYFGWGVYGLNLLLAWAGRTDLLPASMQPIDPAVLDLDVLEQRLLAPALARSATILDGLRQLAGQRATTTHLVLHTINNGMQRGLATHGVDLLGTPSVGVAFLEHALPAPGAAERLRLYPLVIAGSNWNKELLEEAGAPRVELVMQGIDPSHFHPAPRRNLFADRFVVFAGGKLEYRKGQDLVIQAFARFVQHHPEALLLAAWSSPWPQGARTLLANPSVVPPPIRADGTADVTAWAQLNGIAPHQVIDVGAVPNRAMPRILREADVALFPNRAEGGTNLVAMEAMACGVPTILSVNTGHLDLLRGDAAIPLTRQSPIPDDSHRGWGESDVDEIVAALETLYTDRAAAQAQGACGSTFMAGLSWTGQMSRLAGLLTPLV